MEHIVPSLELCQALKDAGWRRFSAFAWEEVGRHRHVVKRSYLTISVMNKKVWAAPTASELTDDIPYELHDPEGRRYELSITKETLSQYYANYWYYENPLFDIHELDPSPTMADAAARLWLMLADKELLK